MFVLSILLFGLHAQSINCTRRSPAFTSESVTVSLSPSLPSNEFNALWDFYNSLNGDNWYWSRMNASTYGKRWNFSESDPNPCSGWYGVTCSCDKFSCHLKYLVLVEFGLKGSLPSTIGAWESLFQFVANLNSITGTIPESIGNWTALENWNMETNHLSGEIPISIGNLINLRDLSLGYNLLTGRIPPLHNLRNLSDIYLNLNSFFGPFPSSIANLCCLQVLYLAHNLLSGTIPPLLSPELLQLDISSNSFVGSTDSFHNMHNIFYLSMQTNFLSGDCANDLSTISKVGSLFFAQNLFTGCLPLNDSWSGFLYDFYAFENYFTGTIAEDFLNIRTLEYFSVGGNYITGTIQPYFFDGQFPRLFLLNISSNLLTGSLPSAIKSSNLMTQLLLNNNFITGSVPVSFSNFTVLVYLWLNNNDLTGTVPFSLSVFSNLVEFFIQNNALEGSISDLLISLPDSNCTNIDLSNNLFTGSLASSFFSSQTSVETFAAVNNCLEGTIPVEICKLEHLTVLALDGMSTAENCRSLFFPGTIFTGFYISHSVVTSTVPSCLFLSTSLESLHLSGNGFSGSIPSSLNISQSLTDLSLSNNQLTGPIPENFQQKVWQNLDLSYNKISGTLSNSFSFIPANGSLSLEVNRLSGTIPSQLINVQSINILDGNIFFCNSKADLPSHDPTQQTYSCGSESVDNFLYLWISCFAVVGSLFCLYYYAKINFAGSRRGEDTDTEIETQDQPRADELTLKPARRQLPLTLLTSLHTFDQWRCSFVHYCDLNPSGNLSVLRIFFQSTKEGFGLIGLLALVFFLPIYSVLTVLNSTYQFEYAWSVSAILLSGEFAAIILFISFSIVSILFVLILLYVLYAIDVGSKASDQISTPRQSKMFVLKDFISFVASKGYNSREKSTKTEHNKWSWLVYIAVAVVDLVLYGLADISYVIIVITYDSKITDFAVVGLALYKFLANDFILSKSIPFISSLFDHFSFVSSPVQESDPINSVVRRMSDYHFTIVDISFLEHLMLVNHVVLPIVAVLIVLPDCFYNAFFAASPSSSWYSFQDIAEGNFGSYYTLNQQTVFTPPFFYSFQCASKVLISFVPLYIMKFCYVGFLRPLKHFFAKLGYDYCFTKYGERSKLWKAFRYCLPIALHNLQSEVSSRPVYQRLSITIQLSSYFAIIVVFGTLFPPLAVLGSVSVLSMIFVEEIILGRVLYESSRAGYEWYKQRLEEDCNNIRETILVSAQSTLFVSCCFFTFLLFDTWGDKNGWKSALPIACCILVPCLLFRLYQVSQSMQFSINPIDRRADNPHQGNRNSCISDGDVELTTTITTENPLGEK
jgi:uncharacterized membrane protein/Leucine-rich repeat (LRR) protein